jgi:hypothetical protein
LNAKGKPLQKVCLLDEMEAGGSYELFDSKKTGKIAII